ncbi:RNA-directed DNA polymerase [Pectobacterium aroidearum]|uniref:RNA-directed DNA polymerase n=1 Tax=Pectobacterium aroidearum TaxID=1201031 RepID=UPI002114F80E|nr:RNA-directed DNA polymerase [Pectobacterium aroidearum]UUE56988.1 RNA-directed DNA polymerase [Pectobacterium aroidearum]UUE69694.1 RNA-directed DNA polymerase [Pectobacterium aroidearum]UUE74067.1 RNA-directed DNA polymerase [Pectobacterium aroidearum]UUE78400.1 RNA-directed DNA polymerase [Pectobacterium aroidearum]
MRTRKLLKYGYFPIQLPPYFNTDTFADKISIISGRLNAQKAKNTKGERYSVARSSFYRRVTTIVNPISYYFLVAQIDKHWSKIATHYRKSSISLSKPKISNNESSIRAIEISKFNELYEAKTKLSSGFQYVLITDITAYFPSIYTHSIPWALHGKLIAKRNNQHTDEFYGNIIDSKSMSIQDKQTMGIPVGPDTSHIISELIGSSIDKELHDELGYWPAGFRYVDDYCLFFNTRDEAERVLAILTKQISNFELQINASKTKILEIKEFFDDSWKYTIKNLIISDNKKQQRDDVHNFFENIISLESKYKDESIIKYSLKQISSTIIRKSNWDVFESYLLRCGYGYPNTLQVIVTILCTYSKYGYNIKTDAIERFCNNLIKTHAIADHHGEISWILTLCKELKINIKRENVRSIESMSSSVCKLMVLDLHHSGVIRINLKSDYLRQLANTEQLHSPDWLLTYEAGKRLWLKNTDTSFIDADYHFKTLIDNNISFYNENIHVKPIFVYKNARHFDYDIFDSEDKINNHFEFDEQDEEYFDSSVSDDDYEFDEDEDEDEDEDD